MATIKLGKRPKNFKATVKFQLLDGSAAAIEMTYIYRTRTEYGAFLDENNAAVSQLSAVSDGGDADLLQRAYQAGGERMADQILRTAEGWNLDEPFDREHVIALCDEMPAGALAIIDTYRIAINEGRLGN